VNSRLSCLDVLQNDRDDQDSEDLDIIALTQGIMGGRVERVEDPLTHKLGVRYTPPAIFHGTDIFTYTVIDTGGAKATGQVTVTVEPTRWGQFKWGEAPWSSAP
jgi:hypothetical protein